MNPYREAIQYLVDHGWYQGGLKGPHGDVCMLGALLEVAEDGACSWFLAAEKAKELFPARAGDAAQPAAEVNDHALTTFEDVVLILEKAALQFEEAVA